ncbi:uncharacterized protein LOC131931021 [Physella acuta]|uniref:uncharacterized protein LOC131931021 n=1 Tax=Physella acuta TaxID=109671 RepID=UPI0027DE41A8|nr:uncharacterized protein LOC131931021 [Physella acuta]
MDVETVQVKLIPNGYGGKENASNECIEKEALRNNKPAKTRYERCLDTKTCKALPIVVSTISIIVCVVCIVFLHTFSQDDDIKKVFTPTCVRSELFNKFNHPELRKLLETLQRRTENTTDNQIEMLCALDEKQLSNLVRLYLLTGTEEAVSSALPPVKDPKNFSMGDASIHRKLLPSFFQEDEHLDKPVFDPHESFQLYFAPEEDNPLLEHTRNVELLTSETVIQKSGLYLVYSSVHFKPDSALPCNHFDQKIWSHNITRTRENIPEYSGVLLTSSHTCCDNCVRNQETSYTAGVFFLHKNDQLRVEVSGRGLVSYRPQSTFFGMAKLGKIDV